ncbi:glycoside hydrolase superfamily [Lipomyces oligophaga]|uniref:glycoside hydrolase superfamily n=1 Tax=Lipomyces oligophaga TaxID=45792 RepID=UPI0034CFB9D2
MKIAQLTSRLVTSIALLSALSSVTTALPVPVPDAAAEIVTTAFVTAYVYADGTPVSSTAADVDSIEATSSAATSSSSSVIRGINVGGWLILEEWLGDSDLWALAPNATDEWTFSEALGDGALAALQSHWSSWFTEDNVVALASYGLNTLRIPIGYWAFLDDDSTPYVQGAADYLDQAIGWAQSNGMKVWVDLHGVPGSQNGYDNSGHSGSAEWQVGTDNLQSTISVLNTMAAKYSGSTYADTVIALELVNEPITWGNSSVDTTKQFYLDAYNSVIGSLTDNQDLQIIMHDGFTDYSTWESLPTDLNVSGDRGAIGLDTHVYHVFSDAVSAAENGQQDITTMDADEHLAAVCTKGEALATANSYLPIYVGEWSAAIDVCFNSDGSSFAGTSCDSDGCSCVSDDQSTWSTDVSSFVRKFVEAQMDAYESNAAGWFFWTFQGPGNWDFTNGVEQGWIPQPLDNREYSSQCS